MLIAQKKLSLFFFSAEIRPEWLFCGKKLPTFGLEKAEIVQCAK